jgi:hypothetical protein
MPITTDYRKDRRHQPAATGCLRLEPTNPRSKPLCLLSEQKNTAPKNNKPLCQEQKRVHTAGQNAAATSAATIKSP